MSITTQIKLADLHQRSDYACMFTHQHSQCVINITISEIVPDNSIEFTITGKWSDGVNPQDYSEVHDGFTFNSGHTQISFIPTTQYEVILIEFQNISIPEGVVITIGLIQSD